MSKRRREGEAEANAPASEEVIDVSRTPSRVVSEAMRAESSDDSGSTWISRTIRTLSLTGLMPEVSCLGGIVTLRRFRVAGQPSVHARKRFASESAMWGPAA